MNLWDETRLQKLIEDEIEENSVLEYKGAGAVDRSASKKKEIAKDVSAMANSSGGTIVYGISEYDEKTRRHLPEKIDPVNRLTYSKEWLDQIINHNVKPQIFGTQIHSIQLESGENHVAYVVEIPESITAHQVTADKDYRYYRRYNFESVPMEDYEIRLVMNRSKGPDASVEFAAKSLKIEQSQHDYELSVLVSNQGNILIRNFKILFSFPQIVLNKFPSPRKPANVERTYDSNQDHLIIFRSSEILYPEETIDLTKKVRVRYQLNDAIYAALRDSRRKDADVSIHWTLYADDMIPKRGSDPFSKFHNY